MSRRRSVAAALAAVAVVGVVAVASGTHHRASRPVAKVAAISASWPTPDDRLTPGLTVPGCTYPRPATQRNVTDATKRAVAAAYRYAGPTGLANLEYDHRIPFSLCGADTAANIWPEPADGTHQSTYVHNAKDQLEAVIASAVRYHHLTLVDAQALFRGDWRLAWCVYVKHPAGTC